MQNFIAVGRLTKDPVLDYSSNGIAKCTFTLAVESKKGSFKKTDFLPMVLWRQAAENASQYLVKGQRVGIEGKVRTSSYIVNGKTVPGFEIEVYEIDYYDAPKK
ncbi:single-stranded DNA-binding protein [Peribacillus loiseleuriae]|uniref:single-stranded DNA-binding protein n=1 Tax=Peribacillus loiseleuriae TaxID=1679170 RepID=UPI003D07E768